MLMSRVFTVVEERKYKLRDQLQNKKKSISSGSRVCNVGMNDISIQK